MPFPEVLLQCLQLLLSLTSGIEATFRELLTTSEHCITDGEILSPDCLLKVRKKYKYNIRRVPVLKNGMSGMPSTAVLQVKIQIHISRSLQYYCEWYWPGMGQNNTVYALRATVWPPGTKMRHLVALLSNFNKKKNCIKVLLYFWSLPQ